MYDARYVQNGKRVGMWKLLNGQVTNEVDYKDGLIT